MKTSYLVFFFLVFFVFKVKGDGGCRDLTFLDCQKNKALVGHVIKTIRVLHPGKEDCQGLCFLEKDCVSYNLGPDESSSRVCILSNTDHVLHPDDVKSAPGAEYCPIKNPCSKNPCPSHTTCKPDFDFDTFKCINNTCAGLNSNGYKENGVYNITPVPDYTVQVFCDQETDGGGWTVIQKRFDGSVNFYHGWDDYKRGFGDKNGEYWLGLDAMHILTNTSQNEIRIDLEDFNGSSYFALYNMFRVGPESQKYKLFLGSYKKGNAGNSMKVHNGMKFTTRDQDNDVNFADTNGNCAETYKGGWWFWDCHKCHLNGEYHKQNAAVKHGRGINWRNVTGVNKSLKTAEMKIRPADFKG